MNTFNLILTKIFDVLCHSFERLDPIWGLVGISVLTGLLMLIIFRVTSNQTQIHETKQKIKAHLLEIRLFKDDLRSILSAEKAVLKYNLRYICFALQPVLFLVVPVMLIMIQLNARYDLYPLRVDNSAILKVKFSDSESFDAGAKLWAPEGLELETPPLRIRSKNEINWRVRAKQEGIHIVEVQLKAGKIRKRINVDQGIGVISVKRVKEGFWNQVLYPAEEKFSPKFGVEYIELNYTSAVYGVFGWSFDWIVIFFAVSFATGFLLRKKFGVEI